MKARKLSKKENPDSLFWRNKCDRLITDFYKNKPCVVCWQIAGFMNRHMTCGHHVVNRSLSAALRHDRRNLIPLCPEHHKFSNTLAAHSTYQPAQTKFVEWLKENNPEAYECLMNYKKIKRTKTYQEIFAELSAEFKGII